MALGRLLVITKTKISGKYQVKLTQLSSNHSRVRTEEILGGCASIPKEGGTFEMFAEPLDETKDVRWLHTSRIKSVQKEGDVYHFETENSKYMLQVNHE
jgi:hypothetical protein